MNHHDNNPDRQPENLSDGTFEEPCDAACRALWLAVIVQLLTDATSKSKRERPLRRQRQAREWFSNLDENHSFHEICELAGVDPEAMKQEIRKILANPELKPDFRSMRSRQK